LVLLVVAAAVTGGYLLTRENDEPASAGATTTTTRAEPTGNAEREEISEEDRQGAGEPIETEPPADVATDPPPDASTGEVADVVITVARWHGDASEVQAGGYVRGVLEREGECTLTLTRDGQQVQASTTAEPDAKTMACGLLSIPRDQLTSGTWTAVLSYASETTSGESATSEVDVP
jgi:hypothetical protein